MKIFNKCIFLFFSLLLLGCSFESEDINRQLNTSEKVRKTGKVSEIVDRIKETKKNLLSSEQSDKILDLFEQQFHKEFIIINYDGSHINSDNYVNLSIASKDNPNYLISTLKYLDDLYIDQYDMNYYEITQFIKRTNLVYKDYFHSIFDIDVLLSSYSLAYNIPINEIEDDDIINFRIGPTLIDLAIEEKDRNKVDEIIKYFDDLLQFKSDEADEIIFNLYVVNDLDCIKKATDLSTRNNSYLFPIYGISYDENENEKFNYSSHYSNYISEYSFSKKMKEIR